MGMWVQSLRLTNIRSFEDEPFEFSRGINLIVGPNNAGKSTVLLPLLSLQEGLQELSVSDLRIGAHQGTVELNFHDFDENLFGGKYGRMCIKLSRNRPVERRGVEQGADNETIIKRASSAEPHNFIYPFLSQRKGKPLSGSVNETIVKQVGPTIENLVAKIDRLKDPEYMPHHRFYRDACESVLGCIVTTRPEGAQWKAIYRVNSDEEIPLDAMGAGTTALLGLLVHLAMAIDRLFLIEEPENDIHPRALRGLLDLILQSSEYNQFMITTHSNIVLKRLGGASDSTVFLLDYKFVNRVPTSTVTRVEPSPEARREVLESLGYELSDLDMWDAWLILEESSAEKIIRKYLIPWFVPFLQHRLRAFSARSISGVRPKFQAFHELFVFIHLTDAYKNRAWVVVDQGNEEAEVIKKLQEEYKRSWGSDHFRQFTKHNFEEYYPDQFADKIAAAVKTSDKQERRAAKERLLAEVEAWIEENDDIAKAAFEQSAAEVIAILQEIATELSPATDASSRSPGREGRS